MRKLCAELIEEWLGGWLEFELRAKLAATMARRYRSSRPARPKTLGGSLESWAHSSWTCSKWATWASRSGDSNRNSTTHIAGLTERENERLLPLLFDHVRSPELQCRFHWEAGSMAFWDNRSVQHYAVADYTERRVMRRVTIDGPPVT